MLIYLFSDISMPTELKIKLCSFVGKAKLNWNHHNFDHIAHTINRMKSHRKYSNGQTFNKKYHMDGCHGSVIAFPSGQVQVMATDSEESMKKVFREGFIEDLLDHVPQIDISIMNDIQLMYYRAHVHLDCRIDIKGLKQFLINQFLSKQGVSKISGKLGCDLFSAQYGRTLIPHEMHAMENVSVVVTAHGHLEIYRANQVKDLEKFVLFLWHEILSDFVINDDEGRAMKEGGVGKEKKRKSLLPGDNREKKVR